MPLRHAGHCQVTKQVPAIPASQKFPEAPGDAVDGTSSIRVLRIPERGLCATSPLKLRGVNAVSLLLPHVISLSQGISLSTLPDQAIALFLRQSYPARMQPCPFSASAS